MTFFLGNQEVLDPPFKNPGHAPVYKDLWNRLDIKTLRRIIKLRRNSAQSQNRCTSRAYPLNLSQYTEKIVQSYTYWSPTFGFIFKP